MSRPRFAILVPTGTRAAALASAASVLLGLSAACSSTQPDLRDAYVRGDYVTAEKQLDDWIHDEHSIPIEELEQRGAAPDVEVTDSELALAYMEKGVLRLAQDDAQASLAYLERSVAAMDEAFVDDWTTFVDPGAFVGGDQAGTFRGADYEHVLLRVMRAVAHIVESRSEPLPYVRQIGECQEKICTSEFGAAQNYKPREQYKRVALGHYLHGVVLEKESTPAEARFMYEEGLKIEPDSAILAAAVARATNGAYAPPDHGAVHVVYLGGQGPQLERTNRMADAVALDVILRVVLIGTDPNRFPTIFQDPINVPAVRVMDALVAPLEIHADGGGILARTETLLDVNEVAQQQLEANMPLILARAAVRRVGKGVGIDKSIRDDGLGGSIAKGLLNFGATAIEKADVRSWHTLPAQIQVARLELPAGEHVLDFGQGMQARVPVKTFDDTFVVVLQPDLAAPGVVLVDAWSRNAAPAAP